LSRRPLFVLGWLVFILVVIIAIFGPMRYDFAARVATPFAPQGSAFWLGTDEQGRDIFTRLAYGARVSLLIGIGVQCIALFTGILLGVLAVYGPTWVRVAILRLTDAMFAFPDILLAILIIGVWGLGITPVVAALSITAWPSVVRLVKTQVATLKDREFVIASSALGGSTLYTVTRHVLPHLWGVLLAVSMVDLAGIILAESALSFLGIGVQPPTPSWGTMINSARLDMASHPTILIWPCLMLSLTIFALNFIGDGLRSMADPKASG
jgi:ABC-type dipeptide/oligopeptide/nickel transport system permease subunit